MPANGNLDRLFYPRSVAVIGASTAPFALTNIFFLYPLLSNGYQGKIYPINPNAEEVLGLKCYASLADVPEPIDNAVCALPAALVPQVVKDCVQNRVRVLTIFTSGFSETGSPEGMRLEREIGELVRGSSLRVVGPNCLGLHCPEAGISMQAGIPRDQGPVAFLSQSGGNAGDIIISGADRQVFFRKLVSFGNAVDLNESDLLEYFADDPGINLIGGYIEGIKEPRRFAKALRRAAESKPVIVLKGGTTDAGSGAVTSHTGALAGNNSTWDALCRQAGVVQVGNMEEMADTLAAFYHLDKPLGRRLGVVGMGGGANVVSADECERAGFILPAFPREIRDQIWQFTPAIGTGVRNPIDTATDIYLDPALLARTVRIVAAWAGIDLVFVCLPVVIALKVGPQMLKDEIAAVLEVARDINKPLAFIMRTVGMAQGESVVTEVQGDCFKAGYPVFRSFEECTRAVAHVVRDQERRRLRDTGAPA